MAREYAQITRDIPDQNDTKKGDAPNSYGDAIAFDSICQTVDVWVFDNAMMFKRTRDGDNYDDEFEIPADTHFSFDGKTHSFNVANKTPDSVARYSIIGWW